MGVEPSLSSCVKAKPNLLSMAAIDEILLNFS